MEFILLINVKIQTIIDFSTFISKTNTVFESFEARYIFFISTIKVHELPISMMIEVYIGANKPWRYIFHTQLSMKCILLVVVNGKLVLNLTFISHP